MSLAGLRAGMKLGLTHSLSHTRARAHTHTHTLATHSAAAMGLTGLRAGMRMGRNLVEEQSGAVVQLLATLADLMGTPAAEVLWIQV